MRFEKVNSINRTYTLSNGANIALETVGQDTVAAELDPENLALFIEEADLSHLRNIRIILDHRTRRQINEDRKNKRILIPEDPGADRRLTMRAMAGTALQSNLSEGQEQLRTVRLWVPSIYETMQMMKDVNFETFIRHELRHLRQDPKWIVDNIGLIRLVEPLTLYPLILGSVGSSLYGGIELYKFLEQFNAFPLYLDGPIGYLIAGQILAIAARRVYKDDLLEIDAKEAEKISIENPIFRILPL